MSIETETDLHPVDVHVGQRLRLRRTIAGMSQDAIGKAIGVTFQQVQKYERGINRVSSSRLYQFAKVLGVPVAYFFEGFESEKSDLRSSFTEANNEPVAYGFAAERAEAFETEAFLNKETIELVRCFNRIGDVQMRKKILELIRSMAGQHEEGEPLTIPQGRTTKLLQKKKA